MDVDVDDVWPLFWVIHFKNTANNGLLYHAGRLLATYETGSAYELALSPGMETKGLCNFGGGARCHPRQ
jgi:carotenoid cleavage dioxygenase-like enzyme